MFMVVTRVTVFSLLESLKCQNAPYLTFYLWFKQHTNVGATTRKYGKHLFKLQQAYLISAPVMEQPGITAPFDQISPIASIGSDFICAVGVFTSKRTHTD